jgi:hypothetical protein
MSQGFGSLVVGVIVVDLVLRVALLSLCRVGTLPEQREGDALDYRPLLHRDGSVFSVVTTQDLQQPE